jgi:hypothetical protein
MKYQASQRQKLAELAPHQFRVLCTDLYDELVRRNLEDQNRSRARPGSLVIRADPVQPDGFDIKRVCARRRLSTLSDGQFVSFVGSVLEELARKSQASSQLDGARVPRRVTFGDGGDVHERHDQQLTT